MNVLYVTVANRQIVIHTDEGIITGSLMVQLERLLCNGLVKVDQNTIVNIHAVESFDPESRKLRLINGEIVDVSRRNRTKVKDKFDKYRDSRPDM
jgi:DNA-binding LytR/AlgR family response regulator